MSCTRSDPVFRHCRPAILGNGVTAARRALVPVVLVRIQVPQRRRSSWKVERGLGKTEVPGSTPGGGSGCAGATPGGSVASSTPVERGQGRPGRETRGYRTWRSRLAAQPLSSPSTRRVGGTLHHVDVAQLVEHLLPKQDVAGSTPVVRSIRYGGWRESAACTGVPDDDRAARDTVGQAGAGRKWL